MAVRAKFVVVMESDENGSQAAAKPLSDPDVEYRRLNSLTNSKQKFQVKFYLFKKKFIFFICRFVSLQSNFCQNQEVHTMSQSGSGQHSLSVCRDHRRGQRCMDEFVIQGK